MSKGINWNIALIAGGAVAIMYFWNKIKNKGELDGEANLSFSGGGGYVGEVTPSVLKTEIRQTENTKQTGIRWGAIENILTKDSKKDVNKHKSKRSKSKNSGKTISNVRVSVGKNITAATVKAVSLKPQSVGLSRNVKPTGKDYITSFRTGVLPQYRSSRL